MKKRNPLDRSICRRYTGLAARAWQRDWVKGKRIKKIVNLKGAMEGKDNALGVTAALAKSGLTRRPQRPLRTQL